MAFNCSLGLQERGGMCLKIILIYFPGASLNVSIIKMKYAHFTPFVNSKALLKKQPQDVVNKKSCS